MRSATVAVWVVVGTALVLVAIVLATKIGGVAIRSTASRQIPLALEVAPPLVPGVHVVVRWQGNLPPGDRPVELWLRDAATEHVIGQGKLRARQAVGIVPCGAQGAGGSLVLLDAATRRRLASAPVGILPAGPDCILR